MGLSGFVEIDDKITSRPTHPTVGHQTRAAHAARAASHAAVAQQSIMLNPNLHHHHHQHQHQQHSQGQLHPHHQ